MNDLLEPPGAPGALGQHRRAEPFGEHLAQAARHGTSKPPHKQSQAHAAPCARQIRGLADVVALDTIRSGTTQRTERHESIVAGGNDQRVFAGVNAVHRQPRRDQRCKTEPGKPWDDPVVNIMPGRHRTAAEISQSQPWTPFDTDDGAGGSRFQGGIPGFGLCRDRCRLGRGRLHRAGCRRQGDGSRATGCRSSQPSLVRCLRDR